MLQCRQGPGAAVNCSRLIDQLCMHFCKEVAKQALSISWQGQLFGCSMWKERAVLAFKHVCSSSASWLYCWGCRCCRPLVRLILETLIMNIILRGYAIYNAALCSEQWMDGRCRPLFVISVACIFFAFVQLISWSIDEIASIVSRFRLLQWQCDYL